MKVRRMLNVLVSIVAIGLFAKSIRVLGLAPIADGIARVGWGFAAIVGLAGARDVVRALAWTLAVEPPDRLPVGTALRARLAGEALNSVLPMGMVVGEPMKASYVQRSVPFAAAFRGLALEFGIYGLSLVPLFGAGVAAFVMTNHLRMGVATAALAGAAAVGAVFLAVGMRLRRAAWIATSRARMATIAVCEAAYQGLSVAETYVTLLLIRPQATTVAAAIALETVSRTVTIFFKMVPLRIGVDEASSSYAAAYVNLDPTTGLTLALVRRLRVLFWVGAGLLLMVGRRAAAAVRSAGPAAALTSAAILMLALGPDTAFAQPADATITGTVALVGPDQAPLVVPGVTVTLKCPGDQPKVEISNDQGEFRFVDVRSSPEECSIAGELQGFSSATKNVRPVGGNTVIVSLDLRLDTLREEVTVRAPAASIDESRAPARVEQISGAMMSAAPVHDRFQDALPLIPGVVRGPDGLLNISGLRSNQSALTFNSANGTDPVTGEDAIELPIDAVSSVQVRGAAYAPEFGLSAGAVTVVETQKAGDTWDLTVNDLEPRLRRRGGEFRGIESWTPRVTVAGPLFPGKVQLLESVQYEYSQTRVFGLPPFESDTKLESFESFTRADWLRSQANRFTVSTLASPRRMTYAGLNTLNPQTVTADINSANVLASLSDQLLAGRGVVETRASVKQFDSTIHPSQGAGPMVLAPNVNSGSYFNDQDRTSRRAEWFTTYSFAARGADHLVKVGGGLTYEAFDGFSRSRQVLIVRANGLPSQTIDFLGDGNLDSHKTAIRGFAQDTWTAGPRLTLIYGARYDHESIAGGLNVAPRGSLSVALSDDGGTVLRGGGGVFYNAVPLNVAAFEQLQTRTVTSFDPGGTEPVLVVTLANVANDAVRAPRSVTWNVELDRQWANNLFVRLSYQQRDNRDEPVVDAVTGAIVLRHDGESRYREAQISARYTFHDGDRIVASYTRSSAVGDLNDFNGFFGNIEQPVIRPNERGPLPWDAPHRVLIWSSVALPRGFAVFPVLDTRTGFPLSNIDADRNFVGPRNQVGRFPTFLSLDAQVTKKFRVLNHNATIGLKVFNITNHFNPRDYQGNLASTNFGGFDNSVGRTFRGKWILEF